MPVHNATRGYEGKSLDAAILLSGQVINRAKHYLAPGEKPPAGVAIKQGARGGKYIEVGGGGAGGGAEEAPDGGGAGGKDAGPYKKNDMVLFMVNTMHGPKQRLGKVDFLRPDGMLEVRDNNGGIHKFSPNEVKPHQPKPQELDEHGYPKMPQQQQPTAKPAAAGPPAGNLGPKAEAALGDAQKLFEQLKAGQLQNPQEFVDAARRAVQVYEDERKDNGPAQNPKRQSLQVAFDRDKQILDRAIELAKKWKDRWEYAKQKGVPGEEMQAVQARMEEAGKEVMSSRMRAHESEKALYQFDNPQQKRQPKPRQPKQARPTVQHKPGDLDREMQSPKQAFQMHQQRPLFGTPEREKPENVAAQKKQMEEAAARYRARKQ